MKKEETKNKEHISYSELKLWVECPWKHKILYIDKSVPKIGSEHTAFGNAVHDIAEFLCNNKDDLTSQHFVEINHNFQVFFLKYLKELKELDPEYEYNKDLVGEMREQGPLIFPHILPALKETFGSDFEVFKAEEDLMEPMNNGRKINKFKGFVDLVIYDKKQDRYYIVDWKTCSWGWDMKRKTDKMTTYQLTLYKKYWCQKNGIDPKKVDTYFSLLKRTNKRQRVEFFKVSSGTRKTDNAYKLVDKATYNIERGFYLKNKMSCRGPWGPCQFLNTEHCKK